MFDTFCMKISASKCFKIAKAIVCVQTFEGRSQNLVSGTFKLAREIVQNM